MTLSTSFKSLLLPLGLASTLFACSGEGKVCEQAFDKAIECGDMDAEQKAKLKKARGLAVAACEAEKDDPKMKADIECAKEDTCDAYNTCRDKVRSARYLEKVNEAVAKGDLKEAARECSYSLNSYKASEDFKKACDEAFGKAFSSDDAELLSDLQYTCTSENNKEYLAASEALKKGCTSLVDTLGKKVAAQRDAMETADFMLCSNYQRAVEAMQPEKKAAAELLCAEAKRAENMGKALAAAKANLDAKSGKVPFECGYAIDDKQGEMKGSTWFPEASKKVAAACYGQLGKLVLADVGSYCSYEAKQTHQYAATYELGKADAELKALLDKTSKKCGS